MKKNKAVFGLFLVLILTAFLCYTAAVGIGPTGTGSAKNIQTGLDLAGGVSITYQTKEKNPSAEDMADTVYKMQRRVEQYSTEAQAYKEGNNRITVEIPGATDADKILSDLGKPGSLCFITQSDTDDNENFSIGEERYVLARSLDEIRRSGSIVLEGSDVADAKGTAYQNSQNGTQYAVSLTLTDEGASKFAEATKENVGKQIAIVYDSQIISAPTVNEAITGGQAQITGMSGIEEAQNLASYIRIGSLSLELEELRSSVVAAQLGEEAISTSIMAGFIGLIIVILFMLVVYRMSISNIHLVSRYEEHTAVISENICSLKDNGLSKLTENTVQNVTAFKPNTKVILADFKQKILKTDMFYAVHVSTIKENWDRLVNTVLYNFNEFLREMKNFFN